MSEWHYLSAISQNIIKPIIILPRVKDHEYSVANREDKFYILSNARNKNFQLLSCYINKPSLEDCEVIASQDKDVFFEDFQVFHDFMVIEVRKKEVVIFYFYKFQDKSTKEIHFSDATASIEIGENWEFKAKKFRFELSSLSTPHQLFEYNIETGSQKLLHKQEVPDQGFISSNYITKRLYIEAHDKKQIPVSLSLSQKHSY